MSKELFSRNFILKAREQAGLSQMQLAQKAKTSQAAISMYESGTRSPSVETLLRIIRAAGFDIRMHLAGPDTHTITRKQFEKTMNPRTLREHSKSQSTRIARGGK